VINLKRLARALGPYFYWQLIMRTIFEASRRFFKYREKKLDLGVMCTA
jgi:hypothetical protein